MTSREAQEWVKLGLIVGGIYVGYKVISEIGKFGSNLGSNLTGPAPGQTWENYFFGSGGQLDAQGNQIPGTSTGPGAT